MIIDNLTIAGFIAAIVSAALAILSARGEDANSDAGDER